MTRCMLCKRTLTDEASAQRGYGDDCAVKYQRYLAACGSSLEEVAILTLHEDATVRRWVHLAGCAVRDGKRGLVTRFIENARRLAAKADGMELADAA